MEKLKKVWKELSVFGVVIIAIIGLYGYRLLVHVDYTTISQNKLISKIGNKDSFVVVTGSSSCTDCSSYQTVVKKYLKDNRSKKIYYIDLDNVSETFIEEYLNNEATLDIAHTFAFEDGEISTAANSLTYYYLDKLFKK